MADAPDGKEVHRAGGAPRKCYLLREADMNDGTHPWILKLVAEMKRHTYAHLSGVYEVIDPMDDGEMKGSATLLTAFGVPYLLTAKHVLTAFRPSSFGGYRSRNGAPPIPLPNIIHASPRPYDVAVIELNPTHTATSEATLLPADVLPPKTPHLAGDVLFIHGLPGKKSRFSGLAGGIVSETFPYATTLGESSYPWFDPNIHFALEYPVDGQVNERNEAVDPPDPHGMSGSLVWKTNYNLHTDTWNANHSVPVGIVHTWDQAAQSLVATRIEVVRAVLLHATRRRAAYLRWEARGKPPGDDWSDWLVAEATMTELKP